MTTKTKTRLQQAQDAVGGLSYPSKMPCPAWSIPATACKRGAKLAKIPGTVCNSCYALRNRYVIGNVQKALERRLKAFKRAPLLWIDGMATLIGDRPYFRWFDSGDLQSGTMLRAIIEVARRTPKTRHWLPTREVALIMRTVKPSEIPDNLTIRISNDIVGEARVKLAGYAAQSMTFTDPDQIPDGWHRCPAKQQGNKCGECRACWSPETDVAYPLH